MALHRHQTANNARRGRSSSTGSGSTSASRPATFVRHSCRLPGRYPLPVGTVPAVLCPPLDAGLRHRPRIRADVPGAEIVAHFRRNFGLDVRHLDELTGRALVVGARPLGWPEAQRLDQLLRQAPSRFVRGNPGLLGVVMVDRNTIVRKGAYRPDERRIVIYLPGQSMVRPDDDVPSYSVFAATVAHELGEAAWETVLTDAQRERYAGTIALGENPRASEEFSNLVMRGLLVPQSVVRMEARIFLRELGLRL